MIGAVQIASLAEGMAIAERLGLDLTAVGEATATGASHPGAASRGPRDRSTSDPELRSANPTNGKTAQNPVTSITPGVALSVLNEVHVMVSNP